MKSFVLCKIFTFNVLLLTIFPVSAQETETWTLEECIRHAIENNIQLRQQRLSVNQAENDLLQSRLSRLPSVNASSNFSSSRGNVLDPNTFTIVQGQAVHMFTGGIGGSMPLFTGFQQRNTIERDRYFLRASIQNVEKLQNDLSINITLYYLQIIHAKEQLKIAENQLHLTELQIARTAILFDAGSVAKGAVLELRSQADREKLQVVMARNALEMSRLNLAQLLDLENINDFQVVIPDFSNIDIAMLAISVEDVYAVAEFTLPEIRAAEYMLKSMERQLAIARGSRSPTLSLSGGYNTRFSSAAMYFGEHYPFWEQLRDGIASYVGVSMTIPVFNGWQVNTNIRNTRLNLQSQQYQLELTRANLFKEIQQAHADALAALQRYFASVQAVASMEETFRYTEQRFELGMMNFVDYSATKTQLAIAQSDMLQAKFEYIFRSKILDFYTGKPIRF